MKYKRIILIVLDGCGVGYQEDYSCFHKEKTNTLGNIYKSLPGLRLPFLESLGFTKLVKLDRDHSNKQSYCGRIREKTAGNDTFAGLWEMFGVFFNKRFLSNQKPLDKILINKIQKECKVSTICNDYLSGFIALDKYYNEHVKTKSPILYLSDDGVILFAAHKDVMNAEKLNEVADKISKVLFNQGFVRIITRPFYGKPGNFIRDEALRKDFLLVDVPRENLIVQLARNSIKIRITQHLARIFDYPKGISVLEKKYDNNHELFLLIEQDTDSDFNLQIYVIPDTDNFGHKKNIEGFGNSLIETDNWLNKYSNKLDSDDLLMITADHGCDPTVNLRGHCREFAPLLVYSKSLSFHGDLGTRDSFADIGQTIADNFSVKGVTIGKKIEI